MLAMCAAPEERIVLPDTPVTERADPPKGSAWALGEEVGYNTGCYSQEIMLAVAEQGTWELFALYVSANFCFLLEHHGHGRITEWIAGPFDLEGGYMGSVWEVESRPFGNRFYLILNETPAGPAKLNYKEA